jgi:hypothetical protein
MYSEYGQILSLKESRITELKSEKSSVYKTYIMIFILGISLLYIGLPAIYEYGFAPMFNFFLTSAAAVLFFLILYYIDSTCEMIECMIEDVEMDIDYMRSHDEELCKNA